MAKYRVFMTDTIFPDTAIEREMLSRVDAEFTLASASDPETLKREGRGCDAAINVYAQLGADILGAWERCKVIVRTGIGFNTIDLEAAAVRRIMVANVPDYGVEEVAGHALVTSASGRVQRPASTSARSPMGSFISMRSTP